ncbi:BON domain-containing protein [Legionella hackeliae]|uniref:Puttaive lipoproteins n=1 Tax=Legionella hackeliae TaxID=449 RepID=A0A0A8UZN1_LEGHA|nr:BON domain-containing protein [Legionella hackeliae]KTD12800.1 hemolysin, lipoprotein [Legionella hackeliae]CEK12224.1 Puttaive lipoproteins [Legionella hackeliae]STX49010.1 hemolysin, lipoprotein [Legionella hackeliae]
MKKQGKVCFILLLSNLLTGCLSNAWTGAMLVYDRHNVYKKVSDYQLSANVHHELYAADRLLEQKGCVIDIAVFNGDILLAGHVPSLELRDAAIARVSKVSGYRRLFNQLDIDSHRSRTVQDSWITAKIRSRIFADSAIDPNVFKVVTSDSIVYLMGDVTPEQAARVISIARNTHGVIRVVKLLKYYHLTDKA